jgi:hypothetical protein
MQKASHSVPQTSLPYGPAFQQFGYGFVTAVAACVVRHAIVFVPVAILLVLRIEQAAKHSAELAYWRSPVCPQAPSMSVQYLTHSGTPASAGIAPLEPAPLVALPLAAVPLIALPLPPVPLVEVPLAAVPLIDVPLAAVPLVALPLPPAPLAVLPLAPAPLVAKAPLLAPPLA